MKIDHSRAVKFRFCPDAYKERYELGLELDWEKLGSTPGFAFGTRVHQLLQNRLLALKGDPPVPETPIVEPFESEAQEMFATYCACYPVEPFSVVDVERVFEIPLGAKHVYTGKFDAVVRDNTTGALQVLEHKTESRAALRNLPIAWAARDQVSLYVYAADRLYDGETVDCILLDVLRRASPKGQVGPEFYRDSLQRSPGQISDSVSDISLVADTIEEYRERFGTGRWPQNRDNCVQGRYRCDYYDLHVDPNIDREQLVQLRYRPAKEYLCENPERT